MIQPKKNKSDLLQRFMKATGRSPEDYAKISKFLPTLAEVESFSGKKPYSDKSTAAGYYHYLKESVPTSDQRTKNLLREFNVPKELQDEVKTAFKTPLKDRTLDQQSLMVYSDLTKSPTAPLEAWLKGEVSDEDLYYKGHYASSRKSPEDRAIVNKNWINAGVRLDKIATSKEPKIDPKTLQNEPNFNPTDRTAEDYYNSFPSKAPQNNSSTSLDYPTLTSTPELNKEFAGGGFLGNLFGTAGAAKGDIMSSLFSSGNSSIGSTLLKGAGISNPLSLYATGADLAFQGAEKLFGTENTFNDLSNTNRSNFNFNATQGGVQGAKSENFLNTVDSTVGKVPIVGSALSSGVSAISSFFRKEADPKDIMQDYMTVARTDINRDQKNRVKDAFAVEDPTQGILAMGGKVGGKKPMMKKHKRIMREMIGEMGMGGKMKKKGMMAAGGSTPDMNYLSGIMPDNKGIGMINAGFPHEQDSNRGIGIGSDSKGEVGEVVVDFPEDFDNTGKTSRFVFSNRF